MMIDMKKVLFGHDDETHIVGIGQLTGDSVQIWTRGEDGTTDSRVEKIKPFVLCDAATADQLVLDGVQYAEAPQLCAGTGHYNHRVDFTDAEPLWKASRGKDTFKVGGLDKMYLSHTGKTLFGGMTLDTVKRMQIDIEVLTADERNNFPNAERPGDEIFIIAMSDNTGWQKVLYSLEQMGHLDGDLDPTIYEPVATEAELIEECVRWVHRRDPDIIEGHNIFGFDLPYLKARAKYREVNFAINRNNRVPRDYPTKKDVAERTFDFHNVLVVGRSVVDTMFLAAEWDSYARELPSLGLKDCAKFFNIAAPDRTYIRGSDLTGMWRTDPAKVLLYALDDVIETEALSRLLLPARFSLSQMVPMTLQQAHLTGTSTMIQSVMVREYLRRGQAIPQAEGGHQQHGGYTDIFHRGVFKDILYADVASLYPTIMLNYDIRPESDELNIFQGLLQYLTTERLRVKAAMGSELVRAGKTPLWRELDAQQSAYKIFINSFYGMLGFALAAFCDISEADRVALTGQNLLRDMKAVIEDLGGKVIEVDTDGILFVRPDYVVAPHEIQDERGHTFNDYVSWTRAHNAKLEDVALIRVIDERMPPFIKIDMDGRYAQMLSYRKKNYILRKYSRDVIDPATLTPELADSYSGKIKIKGGAFKSRGIEPFGRGYVRQVALMILDENWQGIFDLHQGVLSNILNRVYTVEDYRKRATLKMTLADYGVKRDAGTTNPMAAYEIALRLNRRGFEYGPGDTIAYYVSGSKPYRRVTSYIDAKPVMDYTPGDENALFYAGRLRKFAEKFEDLFTPQHFGILFVDKLVNQPGVPTLFPFIPNFDGVAVVNTRLK